MTWTALTYAFGSKLTSTKMTQLYDNLTCAYLQNIAGSNVASLDSTAIFTNAYPAYLITLREIIPATDGADLLIRIGTGSSPTFQSGAGTYSYQSEGQGSGSTQDVRSTDSDNAIYPLLDAPGFGLDNAADSAGLSGRVLIVNPAGTTRRKIIMYDFAYMYNNGAQSIARVHGSGSYHAATAITGIQFLMSAGDITGEVDIEGLIYP